MATKLVLKKWGNSLAAIIPKPIVEKNDLKVNEKIIVEIVKKADLTGVFGSLDRKLSGQEFKNMVREGWK